MSSTVHYFLPREIEGSEQLVALALDLQWSWSHSAGELWSQIDAELWNLTRNPWVVLQTVSRTKLKALSENADFCRRREALALRQQRHAQASGWYQTRHAHQPLNCIAYFSMEFMLSEALPIYSGGLGNVPGDLGLESVRVELYADGFSGLEPACESMIPQEPLTGSVHGYLFTARIANVRPAEHYTPRVVPYHEHAAVPLEASQILWR